MPDVRAPAVSVVPAAPARYLPAFRQALTTIRAGRVLTVDTIRDELTAAGIPQQALGALFQHAARVGWLTPTGTVVPSRSAAARGRLVRQYRRQPTTRKATR